MVKWIIRNKEWLFSGIGVAVICLMISWCLKFGMPSVKRAPKGAQLVESLSIRIAGDLAKTVQEIGRIAVLPLHGDRGNLATDFMISATVRHCRCKVIERYFVEEILKEQRFSQSEFVAPETAAKMGRILGVQAVLVGTVAWGDTPGLSVRLVDSETAEILYARTYGDCP